MIGAPYSGRWDWSYKGWTFEWDTDIEPDNRKRWHYAVHEDGTRITLDWSPYSDPSEADFKRLVDLDFPNRRGPGPLSPEEVERLWGEAVARCPSCGGLNLSCPDGCGRDPDTGELNGTRLE